MNGGTQRRSERGSPLLGEVLETVGEIVPDVAENGTT